eukprot:ctg_3057.g543
MGHSAAPRGRTVSSVVCVNDGHHFPTQEHGVGCADGSDGKFKRRFCGVGGAVTFEEQVEGEGFEFGADPLSSPDRRVDVARRVAPPALLAFVAVVEFGKTGAVNTGRYSQTGLRGRFLLPSSAAGLVSRGAGAVCAGGAGGGGAG